MPIKRSGEKKQTPPSKRDLPHKGPLSAEESFIAPKFIESDAHLVAKPPYFCACCHKSYDQQKGNFYSTKSDLYAGNNHYVTICKSCVEQFYTGSVVRLRDEHQALLHIAQMLDWYVSDQLIDEVLANPSTKKPVGELARRLSIKGAPEGTYLDALVDGVVAITPQTIDEPKQEDADVAIDQRAVELFGSGFTAQEYDLMLQHYDKLLRQFENADGLQEAIIIKLCQIHTAGQIAYIGRDMDGFEKMTRLYNQTLKDERLKARKTEAYKDDESASWGTILAMITQYAPGELYQQPELFRDEDRFDQYMHDTYIRSVSNYFGKTDERDAEYSLTDEEVLGDG